MTIRRRRWERKFPAPPPTPDGYVWASIINAWGGKETRLVKAEEFQKVCQNSIGCLDDLPEYDRKRAKETGEVPDLSEARHRDIQNKRTAPLGFGRAR